jgi:hypothetical protein
MSLKMGKDYICSFKYVATCPSNEASYTVDKLF